MFETKDKSKKFGSAYRAKKYDSFHSEPEAHEAKPNSFLKDEKNNEAEKESEGQHPVVAEHGKATSIHIKHDHVAGKHHVHSTHEDGHENMSEHETPEEAHEEGGKLANISLKKSGEAEDQQLAESEGGNSHSPDGFEMPPLV